MALVPMLDIYRITSSRIEPQNRLEIIEQTHLRSVGMPSLDLEMACRACCRWMGCPSHGSFAVTVVGQLRVEEGSEKLDHPFIRTSPLFICKAPWGDSTFWGLLGPSNKGHKSKLDLFFDSY